MRGGRPHYILGCAKTLKVKCFSFQYVYILYVCGFLSKVDFEFVVRLQFYRIRKISTEGPTKFDM